MPPECSTPQALGITACASYGLFGLLCLVLLARMVFKRRRAALSAQAVFLGIMMAFLGMRVVYFLIKVLPEYCARGETSFVLNRICFCVYFSALSLVLFFWAQEAHRTFIDDQFQFLPGIKRWFFLANFIVYAFQVSVIIVWSQTGEDREGSALYDANILIDEGLVFLMALAFGVYGLILYRLKAGGERYELEGSLTEARWFLLGAVVMLLTYLARLLIFTWRFLISTTPLNVWIFTFFGYLVPEIVPGAIHVYIMRARKRAGSEGKRFIEDLYAQQDSSEIASFLLASGTVDESFVRPEHVVGTIAASPIQSSPMDKPDSLDLTAHDFDQDSTFETINGH